MTVEELRIGLGVFINGTIFGVVSGFRTVGAGTVVDIASPERGSFSTSIINITLESSIKETKGGEV